MRHVVSLLVVLCLAVGSVSAATFVAPSDADSRRFLVEYNDVAERNARLASQYDIDGLSLFRYARGVVARAVSDGKVECAGEQQL